MNLGSTVPSVSPQPTGSEPDGGAAAATDRICQGSKNSGSAPKAESFFSSTAELLYNLNPGGLMRLYWDSWGWKIRSVAVSYPYRPYVDEQRE
jgi:hypothetical protein